MEYELAVKKLAAKCEEKLLKMEELQNQLNERQKELEQVERCSIKSSILSKLSLQFAENQHSYALSTENYEALRSEVVELESLSQNLLLEEDLLKESFVTLKNQILDDLQLQRAQEGEILEIYGQLVENEKMMVEEVDSYTNLTSDAVVDEYNSLHRSKLQSLENTLYNLRKPLVN